MIQHVYVTAGLAEHDAAGRDVLYEVRNTLGITTTTAIRTAKVYRLEGVDESDAHRLAAELLVDVGERFRVNQAPYSDATQRFEVAYRPGVMNPESASIQKAACDLGFSDLVAADSCRAYALYGTPSAADVELVLTRLLVNPTVEERVTAPPATLRPQGIRPPITTVPLRGMDDAALMALSDDALFLDLEEMRVIRAHFAALERDPTDGELETLAQTWSEHCLHKTFNAPLEVDGTAKAPLFSRLRAASERHLAGVVSAFVDNSGVIELYEGWSICGKVETHNSPSAIEPYGGAMTGSGGVFRDIIGTGKGGLVVASTDMFCLAPPDLPGDQIPPGCLAPRYLLRRVVAGVRDYGNRMGIPTCNGSVHFHPDFRAKPSVIVGAYGLIPTHLAAKGVPRVGDVVVAVGGRTGRDGIHGATFSSAAMTARTGTVNASAVQIGNAIEEKRVADAIIVCRDRGLIRAITDCGAGGFSSAIGEMGSDIGVRVDMARAPLKYEGLAPWEIWVSEAQERMVLAVAPEALEAVAVICADHNVEATVLGEFTGDYRLRVDAGDEVVCDLDMEFLHHGVPLGRRTARRDPELQPEPRDLPPPPAPGSPGEWIEVLLAVLGHGDVCSKEPIVRMYDHNVQGSSALAPFIGVRHDGPGDAAVLAPVLGKSYGMVIAHGLHPTATRLDPYAGAVWSIAEAVANACATGARLEDLALIDNFIWPAPSEHWLWALDRAVQACIDAMEALGIPFVSGKDSLSSTYRRASGERLDIPPVLCVSAFGRVPDVHATVSSDLKRVASHLILLGHRDRAALGASVYDAVAGGRPEAWGGRPPVVDLPGLAATVRLLHGLVQGRHVLACHDVSQGGLATTLAEMAIGGDVGVAVDLQALPTVSSDVAELFAETAGCFVVETTSAELILASAQAAGVPGWAIGRTLATPEIRVTGADGTGLFEASLSTCRENWQRPMREVFHGQAESSRS